jgi:hypothetical protein
MRTEDTVATSFILFQRKTLLTNGIRAKDTNIYNRLKEVVIIPGAKRSLLALIPFVSRGFLRRNLYL